MCSVQLLWLTRERRVHFVICTSIAVIMQDIQQLIEVGWSRGQIAHALLIMASYHSLCGMVYSCGILPDQQETSVILYDSLSETSADELLAQSCDLTPDLFSSAPSGSRTGFSHLPCRPYSTLTSVES